MAGSTAMLVMVAMGALAISACSALALLVWWWWSNNNSQGTDGSGTDPPVLGLVGDIGTNPDTQAAYATSDSKCNTQACLNYIGSHIESSSGFDTTVASDCAGCEQRTGAVTNGVYVVNKVSGGQPCYPRGLVALPGLDAGDPGVRNARGAWLKPDNASCTYDTTKLAQPGGKESCRKAIRAFMDTWNDKYKSDPSYHYNFVNDPNVAAACKGCGYNGNDIAFDAWIGGNVGFKKVSPVDGTISSSDANEKGSVFFDVNKGSEKKDGWASWYVDGMPDVCGPGVKAAAGGLARRSGAATKPKPKSSGVARKAAQPAPRQRKASSPAKPVRRR